MPHDPRKLQIGHQVPGTKWIACGRLGEGGMGMVWEVVKPPGIRGAMKMMLPHLSARAEVVERFLGEVRLLATLEHTNIVRLYDCDVVDDGSPFLVMELLQGGTLRASMRHYGRTIPPDAAYDIIRGMGEGLDRAHTAGVVHRDVKPENTFLHCHENDRPRIVLLDFGIATLMEGSRQQGEIVSTPLYMAPEQLRGERETARTDIYAMGLVLYEMLTGRLPWDFTGATARDIAHAHLYALPAPASQFAAWMPRDVDKLIASALEKDPARRPQDVFAFTSKLFELQWCRKRAIPINVNTTVPTLSTLAEVSQWRGPAHGTDILSSPLPWDDTVRHEYDPRDAIEVPASPSPTPPPTFRSVGRRPIQGSVDVPPDGRLRKQRVAVLALNILGGSAATALLIALLSSATPPGHARIQASGPSSSVVAPSVTASPEVAPTAPELRPTSTVPLRFAQWDPIVMAPALKQPIAKPIPARVGSLAKATGRSPPPPAASSNRKLTDEQRELLDLVRDKP